MAEGHRERLRQRFLNEPIESIPEYVVLEMMLQGVIVRKDTCGMARQLLEKFGSLAGVIEAPLEEITSVPGIGEAAAYQLKFMPKFYRKYCVSKWESNVVFDSVDMVGRYLADRCVGYTREAVFLVCMDSKMRLIECPLLAEGVSAMVDVSIRKILETALCFNATRVVLAHTHPGGSVVPSAEDMDSTIRLKKLLDTVGIVLDDHIIVAGNKYASVRQFNKNL